MIPEPFIFETKDATTVGWVTCCGWNNCFSVRTKDGEYNVLNFYHETLAKLLEQKVIKWPIKITALDEKRCVINDPRIENKDYRPDFCRVCCPMDMLPIQQRLEMSRAIARGEVTYKQCDDGMLIQSTQIKAKDNPLKDWVVEHGKPTNIYCLRDEEDDGA